MDVILRLLATHAVILCVCDQSSEQFFGILRLGMSGVLVAATAFNQALFSDVVVTDFLQRRDRSGLAIRALRPHRMLTRDAQEAVAVLFFEQAGDSRSWMVYRLGFQDV